MKTIVRTNTNVSLYLFEDTEIVDIQDDQTLIGEPVTLYIADCDSSNVQLFENVESPTDWYGCKYLYTADNGWELNPDWVEPESTETTN